MTSNQKIFQKHFEESVGIQASAEKVFAFIDDHSRLSSHMSRSSWMMGGGNMEISVDAGHGQRVGSHIRLNGRAFGIKIYLDEVVTRYEPPYFKIWETVSPIKLLVIGHYRMGIEIKPQNQHSLLRIFIDYDLPQTNIWMGWLFGGMYAKWCVRQMIKDAHHHFHKNS